MPSRFASPRREATATATATTVPRPTPRPTPRHFQGEGYRIEESIGYLMKLAMAGLRRELDGRMAQHALTGVQMLPLLLIGCGECRTAAELARLNDSDAGATTRLLDRLQAKGLLQRRRSAADRRVQELELTPAGQDLAAQIPHVIAESLNHALRDFRADEVDSLRAMLRRIIANVEPGT